MRKPKSLLSSWRLSWAACAIVTALTPQRSAAQDGGSQLSAFSRAVQQLTAHVSPSVVRISVTRYGPVSDDNGRTDMQSGKQSGIGSGVIVDPDGYILTNAHVVEGAQRIKVDLLRQGEQTIPAVLAHPFAAPLNATLVGLFKEGDIALLKIDKTGLPSLRFADYDKLQQGEVVFAMGSPAGLQNSVSMGVVSSIARQPDPDSPFLYIQTDTPINPGNSGGPLVNAQGEIVGLNTFILTNSGGSEGVGFAIPSMLLQWVFGNLKRYGHVHRSSVGLGLQAISPTLAAALDLPRSAGVVVSDVTPGGPAEMAGVKINDVLVSVGGRPVDSVPAMLGFFFQHGAGEHIKFDFLRGGTTIELDLVPTQVQHQADRLADLADINKDLLPSLGILGVTASAQTAPMTGELRMHNGVVVAARTQVAGQMDPGLQVGDVIHTVNGVPVPDVGTLKGMLGRMQGGEPVALLVERHEQLEYLTFDYE